MTAPPHDSGQLAANQRRTFPRWVRWVESAKVVFGVAILVGSVGLTAWGLNLAPWGGGGGAFSPSVAFQTAAGAIFLVLGAVISGRPAPVFLIQRMMLEIMWYAESARKRKALALVGVLVTIAGANLLYLGAISGIAAHGRLPAVSVAILVGAVAFAILTGGIALVGQVATLGEVREEKAGILLPGLVMWRRGRCVVRREEILMVVDGDKGIPRSDLARARPADDHVSRAWRESLERDWPDSYLLLTERGVAVIRKKLAGKGFGVGNSNS